MEIMLNEALKIDEEPPVKESITQTKKTEDKPKAKPKKRDSKLKNKEKKAKSKHEKKNENAKDKKIKSK